MSRDAGIGVVILFLALATQLLLVARSRRIISRIAAKRLGSVREILKDLDGGC